MGGVRKHAAGVVLETVPLLHEVVAAVVADLVDQIAMRVTDLSNMWCVDHDFATVGYSRLDLVHTFAGGPHVVIHFRHHAEHAAKGVIHVKNVLLRREFRCCVPGLRGRVEEETGESVMRDDEGETPRWTWNQLCGTIDDGANRSVSGADNVVVSDNGAEPVCEVDDLGACNAGEEILVAPGETDDLVRKDGSANDDVVVVKDQLV